MLIDGRCRKKGLTGQVKKIAGRGAVYCRCEKGINDKVKAVQKAGRSAFCRLFCPLPCAPRRRGHMPAAGFLFFEMERIGDAGFVRSFRPIAATEHPSRRTAGGAPSFLPGERKKPLAGFRICIPSAGSPGG